MITISAEALILVTGITLILLFLLVSQLTLYFKLKRQILFLLEPLITGNLKAQSLAKSLHEAILNLTEDSNKKHATIQAEINELNDFITQLKVKPGVTSPIEFEKIKNSAEAQLGKMLDFGGVGI